MYPRLHPTPWLLVLLAASAACEPPASDLEADPAALSREGYEPTSGADRGVLIEEAAILNRPEVGLDRLLRLWSTQPGPLLDSLLRAFAQNPDSERRGPVALAEELRRLHGAPSSWNVRALPFTVTAIYNRIDLRVAGEHCGEIRIEVQPTARSFEDLYLLFILRQPRASGRCRTVARDWTALRTQSSAQRLTSVLALVDEAARDDLVIVETLEALRDPTWEARQWRPRPGANPNQPNPGIWENPPLTETIDARRVIAPGAARDAFLAYVSAHRGELIAGLGNLDFDPALRSSMSFLRSRGQTTGFGLGADVELCKRIAVRGCASCHATQASGPHRPGRGLASGYLVAELAARSAALDGLATSGATDPPTRRGPLQASPDIPRCF